MSQKIPGYHMVPGYWGRSPAKIIDSYQKIEHIRVLLQDKLIARGRPAQLWRPVDELTPGTIQCTCVKNTNDVAQRLCPSCYGVGLVPGVLKFNNQTIFFDIAEHTTFTLVNTLRDTVTKPHMFEISSGQLSGTIETPDKTFTNPDDVDWEVESQIDLKVAGNTVLVEFSTDGGTNFFDISLINGANKPTGTTGNIRLRITLTRGSTSDRSPRYEITRIRRVESENYNNYVIDARRGTFAESAAGDILILPTWTIKEIALGASVGHQIEDRDHRMWTSPLDFFDLTIGINTPDARIFDVSEGPHPMIEYSTGTEAGRRYALVRLSASEDMGPFTHQAFTERRSQRNEAYRLIF